MMGWWTVSHPETVTSLAAGARAGVAHPVHHNLQWTARWVFNPRANKQTLRNKQKEKESDKYFLICVLCLTYTILKCCISSVNQSCILQLANGLCSWKNWHISFVDKVDGYGFWRKVEQNRFQSVARTLEGKWLGVNVKALVWACKPKFNIMNPHQGTIVSLCSISYLVYSLKFNIPILSQNNLTQ